MATGGEDLMNAVVLGATGATGKSLVGLLLKTKDKVGKVTLLLRRRLESVDPKHGVNIRSEERAGRLQQHVEDLDDVSDDTVRKLCTGHHVIFNCLGEKAKLKHDKDEFRHIEYEIPIRLIKLAHQANVPHCTLITSLHADSSSFLLSPRVKGELEDNVKGLKFHYTTIFRPTLLDRGEAGHFMEKAAMHIFTYITVDTLAEAMMRDAWNYFSSDKWPVVALFTARDASRLSKEGNTTKQ